MFEWRPIEQRKIVRRPTKQRKCRKVESQQEETLKRSSKNEHQGKSTNDRNWRISRRRQRLARNEDTDRASATARYWKAFSKLSDGQRGNDSRRPSGTRQQQGQDGRAARRSDSQHGSASLDSGESSGNVKGS